MATHRADFEWQESKGIIINLLQNGYLECKIWAIIPINGARINQLCNVLKNSIDTLYNHHPPHIHVPAIHDSDMDVIKVDAKTWEWEVKDGFPYTHRCSKQYLLDATLTFTKLHQRYKAKIKASNDGACVVSYSKWI
jgi:uncharacterized protein YsxB (DUF464 family)